AERGPRGHQGREGHRYRARRRQRRARRDPEPAVSMASTPIIERGGDSPSAPPRGRRDAPRRSRGLSVRAIPYALRAPGLLVIAVLLLYPLAQMVWTSFHEVGLRQVRARNPQPAEFTGWDNYRQVTESELFWSSLRNTVLFALVAVV